MSFPYYLNNVVRFRNWEKFKEEIGKTISPEKLLDLLQSDKKLLDWIYDQSPYSTDYEKVGQYLHLHLSATEWLEVFAQKSPVKWERILEEMLGKELYSKIKKIKANREAAEKAIKQKEEKRRKEEARLEEERRRKEEARLEEERRRKEEARLAEERSKIIRPGLRRVWLANKIEFPFRWCPPGTFLMGEGNFRNKVILTKGFWMLETPVTQAMWQCIMGTNPSYFKGRPKNPVECVSWNDTEKFCLVLTKILKRKIKLPTEAQWEYACLAGGINSPFTISENDAWFSGNSNEITHFVGLKAANTWGLRDMCGNVSEWCADWYSSERSPYLQKDPEGPKDGYHRVVRGGNYRSSLCYCTPTFRSNLLPTFCNDYLGFRVILCPLEDEK